MFATLYTFIEYWQSFILVVLALIANCAKIKSVPNRSVLHYLLIYFSLEAPFQSASNKYPQHVYTDK